MTLDKAIEILEDFLAGDEPDYSPDLPDAIRLLIEAGKRLHASRFHRQADFIELLPGETR